MRPIAHSPGPMLTDLDTDVEVRCLGRPLLRRNREPGNLQVHGEQRAARREVQRPPIGAAERNVRRGRLAVDDAAELPAARIHDPKTARAATVEVALGIDFEAVRHTGLGAADLGTGDGAPTPRVAAGISLLRVLLRSETALLRQISEIDVSRSDGPVLYTVEGVEVRLGAEDWEARLGRLQGVLAQVRTGGEPVSAIDLRFRDQVVLKTVAR